MNYRFAHTITPAFTELRLLRLDDPVPVDNWAIEAPEPLLRGVALSERLRAADLAVDEGPALLIEHEAVASLSAHEANLLGFPPLADAVAAVSTRGVIIRPDFTADLVWKRPTGQAIAGTQRCGAWLRIGQTWQRLPDVLFSIAEQVDKLRAAAPDDTAGRMAALAELRDILPAAESSGKADTSGLIRSMTIAVADAFSLDVAGDGEASRLVPVLYRSGSADTLLPPDQQRAFGEDQFNRFTTARPMYAIGAGTYVVLSPPLRAALAEVRRVQGAPLATKRALLASPRAFLQKALGDDTDTTVLESVFRETQAYSDRVVGLGLWQPRVLPWITLSANDWFDSEAGSDAEEGRQRPEGRGLRINDRAVPLTPTQAQTLQVEIEAAIEAKQPTVSFPVDGETLAVPANAETLVALSALQETFAPPKQKEADAEPAKVLVIQPNEEAIDIEAYWTPRGGLEMGPPTQLRTHLKAHQVAGLTWLQQAWRQGRPGVLLADDMGLGKTLQALAFLAWLRECMVVGHVPQAPLLIVAPTGLLENWRQEHDTHLKSPGLGTILRAYGKNLAEYRSVDGDGRPCVSVATLRGVDCVLTTYETLRDYDRDFGQVRFAAAVFDEAQKIKTPGIRLTDAAKAMNVEFRVAMTGTPVENRLSDLWCIVDSVHAGYLGELKGFSTRYERNPEEGALRSLKDQLDRPRGGRPPLMLRRLRWDHLPDLPACEERVLEEEMPPRQREAYEEALARARNTTGSQGEMLAALSALRRVSLHPTPDSDESDDDFIGYSARLRLLFNVLDAVRERAERTLIFLDDRDLQAKLTGLIQRRYRLSVPPMIINGAVPGVARQARVNKFQSAAGGFDVMLLSPRAGGVGLTLTSANHAIHLERWWNPAVEDQCTGRVLRIGQKRPVTVHVPQAVCSGRRSFDQNLHALLQRKRELVRDTLGTGELCEDESRALLRDTIG